MFTYQNTSWTKDHMERWALQAWASCFIFRIASKRPYLLIILSKVESLWTFYKIKIIICYKKIYFRTKNVIIVHRWSKSMLIKVSDGVRILFVDTSCQLRKFPNYARIYRDDDIVRYWLKPVSTKMVLHKWKIDFIGQK